jgi:hypothetical protein
MRDLPLESNLSRWVAILDVFLELALRPFTCDNDRGLALCHLIEIQDDRIAAANAGTNGDDII